MACFMLRLPLFPLARSTPLNSGPCYQDVQIRPYVSFQTRGLYLGYWHSQLPVKAARWFHMVFLEQNLLQHFVSSCGISVVA